eukprot:TRINITY_DN5236_c0_g1_i5.p1 TRINITY_DN5236_c0_g1~~TRINITY_DN5236_c0_g1_i5.p1  ORF type:complete len:173 (-),score=39.76 TRINITY_DN5236_c0_g1_i5:223-741(-)
MGTLNKVIMRFEEPFWPKDVGFSFGAIPSTIRGNQDEEDLQYFPLFVPHTDGKPILYAFCHGKCARAIENLSDHEVSQLAMKELRNIFPKIPNDLVPTWVVVTRWTQDPWSYGSYSHISNHSVPQHREDLAKPVGRLFFAGEATHISFPSTTHGALMSGREVAQKIATLSRR